MECEFEGPVWSWRGPSPYHFVRLPPEHADAIGVTVADADRPFRARLETAIPSSVHAAAPRNETHPKVTQSDPEGSATP